MGGKNKAKGGTAGAEKSFAPPVIVSITSPITSGSRIQRLHLGDEHASAAECCVIFVGLCLSEWPPFSCSSGHVTLRRGGGIGLSHRPKEVQTLGCCLKLDKHKLKKI